MSDQASGTRTGEEQGSPKPEDKTTAGAEGAAGDEPKGDEHDPVRAKALIDKLRPFEKAAKDAQKTIDELKAQVQAHADEKLSAEEKVTRDQQATAAERDQLKQQVAQLEQSIRDAALRSAVLLEALKLNAADPDDVFALLDRAAVEFDDQGRPKDVEKAVKALLDRKPHLVKQGAATTQTQTIPGSPKGKPAAGAGKEPDEALQKQVSRVYQRTW